MTTPTFDDVASGLASTGMAALQDTLKSSWASYSEDERRSMAKLMGTLVKARLYEAMGRSVDDFLPVLNVALENWKVVGKQVVNSAIHDVFTKMFGFAGAFAGSALTALIKGFI